MLSEHQPGSVPPPPIRLRNVEPADLSALFQHQLDPEGNRMAATKPRDAAAFDAVWARVFADTTVVARASILDDPLESTLVGSISRFKRDGLDYVGYWIARDYWGKGIATRALALLLQEVTTRPLHARVATANTASLRVLQRCGFTIRDRRFSPATDRFLECEEAILTLA